MRTVDQQLARVLCCRVGVGNWTQDVGVGNWAQAVWQSSGASRKEGFKAGLLSCAQVPQAHSGDVGRVGFFSSWKTGQNRMAVKWWWTLWAPHGVRCLVRWGRPRAFRGRHCSREELVFFFPSLSFLSSLLLPGLPSFYEFVLDSTPMSEVAGLINSILSQSQLAQF